MQAVAAQLPLPPLATQPVPPTTGYYHPQTPYPPNYYPYYPLNHPPFVQNGHPHPHLVLVTGLETHVGNRVWVSRVRVRANSEAPAENPHPRGGFSGFFNLI